MTVHDLSFEHFPDVMGLRDRFLFRTQVPRAVRKAARVLTGSEWTKRDLVERYGLEPDKVVVTRVRRGSRSTGPTGRGRRGRMRSSSARSSRGKTRLPRSRR